MSDFLTLSFIFSLLLISFIAFVCVRVCARACVRCFLLISCFQVLRINSVQRRWLQILYKTLIMFTITENNEQLALITTNLRPSQSHWESDANPQMPWRPTVTSSTDSASSKACNLLQGKTQDCRAANLVTSSHAGGKETVGVWNSIYSSQESPQAVYAARLYHSWIPIPKRQEYIIRLWPRQRIMNAWYILSVEALHCPVHALNGRCYFFNKISIT